MSDPVLRAVAGGDLEVFFAHQQDPGARRMAAFTSKDPADRAAFDTHWAALLRDPTVAVRTILLDGRVAGHIASFLLEGQREITYWVGREFWGRGVATRALREFLAQEATRPIHARVAWDNSGSIRVLEKCGFALHGRGAWYSHARGREIEELLLKLEQAPG